MSSDNKKKLFDLSSGIGDKDSHGIAYRVFKAEGHGLKNGSNPLFLTGHGTTKKNYSREITRILECLHSGGKLVPDQTKPGTGILSCLDENGKKIGSAWQTTVNDLVGSGYVNFSRENMRYSITEYFYECYNQGLVNPEAGTAMDTEDTWATRGS